MACDRRGGRALQLYLFAEKRALEWSLLDKAVQPSGLLGVVRQPFFCSPLSNKKTQFPSLGWGNTTMSSLPIKAYRSAMDLEI